MRCLSLALLLFLFCLLHFNELCECKKSKSKKRNKKTKHIESEEEQDLWTSLEEKVILLETGDDAAIQVILDSINEIMEFNKWPDLSVFMKAVMDYHDMNLLAVAINPKTGQTPMHYYSHKPAKYWTYFVLSPFPENLRQFWTIVIDNNKEYVEDNFTDEDLRKLFAFSRDMDQQKLHALRELNHYRLKDSGFIVIKKDDELPEVEVKDDL